jgi:hypothetical protein
MGLKPSGPSGPSPEELAAQAQREADLKKQKEMADIEAERLRKERISSTGYKNRLGRASLIATSELGVTDKLG